MWVNMMGEQKKFIAGDGSVKNLQKEQHNQNKRNTVGKNFTADLNRIEFLFPASHIFSYGFTAVVVRCSFSFIMQCFVVCKSALPKGAKYSSICYLFHLNDM